MFKYFMSHSIKDKEFVNEFINLLILGGSIKNAEIFCTSRAGDDIVPGNNFVEDIGEHLKDAQIVFCFFSSRYLDSTFCMAELGAAWILKKTIIPIIISDINFDETTPFCRSLQGIKIDNEAGLHSLMDKLKDGYTDFKVAAWSEQGRVFIKNISKLLQEKISPNKISYEQHLKAQQKILFLENKNKELNETIEQRDKTISLLRSCKDKDEVKLIEMENEPQIELFENLCEEIGNTINDFPDIVRELCFRLYSLEEMFSKELKNYSDIREAMQYQLIDENGETVHLKTKKNKINDAVILLEKMKNMIENADDSLYAYISEKFGGNDANMRDKEFWIDVLNVRF